MSGRRCPRRHRGAVPLSDDYILAGVSHNCQVWCPTCGATRKARVHWSILHQRWLVSYYREPHWRYPEGAK